MYIYIYIYIHTCLYVCVYVTEEVPAGIALFGVIRIHSPSGCQQLEWFFLAQLFPYSRRQTGLTCVSSNPET